MHAMERQDEEQVGQAGQATHGKGSGTSRATWHSCEGTHRLQVGASEWLARHLAPSPHLANKPRTVSLAKTSSSAKSGFSLMERSLSMDSNRRSTDSCTAQEKQEVQRARDGPWTCQQGAARHDLREGGEEAPGTPECKEQTPLAA